jgi:hypothetical protein
VTFIVSRGKRLNWGFTTCDRHFYISFGKAALVEILINNVSGIYKSCSAMWKFRFQLSIYCRAEENYEILNRVGRLQDLPVTNWAAASSSAFRYTNSNISLYLCYGFFLKTLQICYQVDLHSGKAPHLCSGGAQFESRLVHCLFWLKVFVFFLSPFGHMPRLYFDWTIHIASQILSHLLFISPKPSIYSPTFWHRKIKYNPKNQQTM